MIDRPDFDRWRTTSNYTTPNEWMIPDDEECDTLTLSQAQDRPAPVPEPEPEPKATPSQAHPPAMWDERDQSWRDDAACVGVGVDAFFPYQSGGGGMSARHDHEAFDAARAICAGCTVRRACLNYAQGLDAQGRKVATPELGGMWGGLTDRERREMRRGAA